MGGRGYLSGRGGVDIPNPMVYHFSYNDTRRRALTDKAGPMRDILKHTMVLGSTLPPYPRGGAKEYFPPTTLRGCATLDTRWGGGSCTMPPRSWPSAHSMGQQGHTGGGGRRNSREMAPPPRARPRKHAEQWRGNAKIPRGVSVPSQGHPLRA